MPKHRTSEELIADLDARKARIVERDAAKALKNGSKNVSRKSKIIAKLNALDDLILNSQSTYTALEAELETLKDVVIPEDDDTEVETDDSEIVE